MSSENHGAASFFLLLVVASNPIIDLFFIHLTALRPRPGTGDWGRGGSNHAIRGGPFLWEFTFWKSSEKRTQRVGRNYCPQNRFK